MCSELAPAIGIPLGVFAFFGGIALVIWVQR